jgi:ABC-type uncharacterized transport system substrate-binding protein
LKASYTEHFESAVEHLQQELNKHGITVIQMDASEDVLSQVRQAIGERSRARTR